MNMVGKWKKIVYSIVEHNVEDHINDIMDDIKDEDDFVQQAIKPAKMSNRGEKFPKNILAIHLDNVSFHSK